ncbi:Os1348 family NHLP clan protein [Ruminiclostridium papyrosolvens]|uniref:Uncharacterized protein n=1 Tax=Ruminiclostridium papyrosolvens C7 TaxID=1330534 RepID=U4QZS7_9FIRM|nr:Os1348 family NHLP clan protein [Ruminiclostridium papyrosolvens]EPR10512.1 hypothetical protein L323_13030 [Ruminiclostridium papyrosolvens C7]
MMDEKNGMEMQEDSSGIKMVIIRILSDEDFKQELIEDPDTALEGYELTEVQKILIKSLSPEDLDNLSPDNIEEYFSADAAVYTPDEGASLDEFDTFEGDDLLDEDEDKK